MADEDDERRPNLNDPESEACFRSLAARIAWELDARIAAGDDPSTPDGRRELSELIADAILDVFVIRDRTVPRYRPESDAVNAHGYVPGMTPRGSKPSPEDDDVSIDELREAVEHLHGVPATFVESVEVDERFNGAVVWQGVVKVFALANHPSGATRAYAWSHRVETTKRLDGGEVRHGRRKFKAVLGVPPVDSAVMAVRASILADEKKREN